MRPSKTDCTGCIHWHLRISSMDSVAASEAIWSRCEECWNHIDGNMNWESPLDYALRMIMID